MRLIEQTTQIAVKNIDNVCSQKKRIVHSTLLPNSIRALIVGPSNCGKTNVMISLIESPNGLKFRNIYIYSKSLYQPKYQYLKKLITPIKGINLFTFSENEKVISPAKANMHSIMVFDDVICDKQNTIRDYFCMGRHKHIDCFYLCQTYTRIPKHLIRDNANMIIIFKQDEMNIKHIYNDHVLGDMTFKDFLKLCSECWKDKYGFLIVSKDDPIDKDYKQNREQIGDRKKADRQQI
ncbi:uncharacterized protein LOC131994716 [Stomoxys calcitrans]|uniref:uncharacterized protein LOC131994715 n=1 Tax=Stomoxys calcitrans TaxID=35570 RepID=UPI0027E2C837|nr:uncharacterized protein LOC131994715 [Stomoxys calcitrans]XP_059217536.1 uncharacterized protein LOC131994716 [Stomoxys calcitrans]